MSATAVFGTRRAKAMVERNILNYQRGWIFFFSGFLEPFFYLLSIGIGLNHLVGAIQVGDRHIAYASFVAPGLLAAAAMNGAILDATFNIFFKLKISHTYDTVLATPLSAGDVALGELIWSLIRGGIYSAAFLSIMAGLGYASSSWAILCFPAALLVAFGFAGIGMACTTYMRSWQDFDMISLALIPMFLFSATFFPLTIYPGWIQAIVSVTPLYQGVALMRGFDLDMFNWALLAHALYLIVVGFVGLAVASRRLSLLLLP